ncbi:MAG TPA: phosphatidate cytidylyltransferase [Syntrophomonadaceae bacterium]|nr:phosphatidate cytidylyltransferase [Syntrophomonadaceae bacterium]
MFKTRFLTAIIGIPALLGILYTGGILWDVCFGLLGIVGMYEIFAMMSRNSYHPIYVPGYLLLLTLLYSSKYLDYLPLLLFLNILIIVVYTVVTYPRNQITDVALSISAAVYLGWTLHYAEEISAFSHAFEVIVVALVLTWASDIGGYLFGYLWGKHKMVPLLSPKKTWEGAVGATILPVMIAGAAYYWWPALSLNRYLLLGLAGGIIAQFGDLFISAVKRFFAVKDSGHILPGHGGVLDRFDSFMLVVPVVYYFFINII